MESSDDDKPVLQLIANKMKSNNGSSTSASAGGSAPKQPINIKTQAASPSSLKTTVSKNEGSNAGTNNSSNSNNNSNNNSNSKSNGNSNGNSNSNNNNDNNSKPSASSSSSGDKSTDPSSDSDDDIPIVELVKKRKNELDEIRTKKRAKDDKHEKEERDKDRKKEKEKEREREKSSSSSKDKDRDRDRRESSSKSSTSVKRETGSSSKSSVVSSSKSSSSSVGSASASKSQEFYDTLKGRLVQKLLIRWWYSIEWPKPSEIGVPPAGYEPLVGFKGVFVSTRTDSLGQILDLRDKTNCPSLMNLVKKPSSELKELVISAIKNQMTALAAAEGDDCKGLDLLSSEMGEVKKIDADKADRDGKNYLTAFGNKK